MPCQQPYTLYPYIIPVDARLLLQLHSIASDDVTHWFALELNCFMVSVIVSGWMQNYLGGVILEMIKAQKK